jgi:hypothetical protein
MLVLGQSECVHSTLEMTSDVGRDGQAANQYGCRHYGDQSFQLLQCVWPDKAHLPMSAARSSGFLEDGICSAARAHLQY